MGIPQFSGSTTSLARIVSDIEREVESKGVHLDPVPGDHAIVIHRRVDLAYRDLARLLLRDYRKRSLLGFTLMVTQSFHYNAIFFTYALILASFYGIHGGAVSYFIFPFALGNLLGPLLLGPLFDTVGRRIMIGSTYTLSGLLLFVTGWLFGRSLLTALTQTILWCVIFFLASAAASSGYLTVSEVFPLELRAQAISFFFAIATLSGGVVAPWLFATLIGNGDDRGRVFLGYGVAAALMVIGGLAELRWGVNAEGRSLEAVATPLSARASAATERGLTGGLISHVRRAPGEEAPPGRDGDDDRMSPIRNFLQPAIAILVAIVVAWLIAEALHWLVGRIARRSPDQLWTSLQQRCRRPVRFTLVVTALFIALPEAQLGAQTATVVRHVITLALIAAAAWLVIALTGVVEDVMLERINIDVEDNRRARRIRTQLIVLSRVVVALIVFLAIATALMTFPKVRTLGASLLASAGVLSVVVGLAAQATLANLIAGLQIAFTDPIRIDDVVVVDGEWGRIEEITLTYVVVHAWDNRRLILPVSWFTSNVFQNWTRREARVLGSVVIHTDFTVPVDEVRAEVGRLLQESPLWDGRDWVLQVVDTTPTTMMLRALMSSADAPSNWDLRCEVREKLLAFLRDRYPGSLPKLRTEAV